MLPPRQSLGEFFQIKKGDIFGEPILDLREKPSIENVDTITLYLNANNQHEWEDYMLSLKPKHIIFNPGAENFELAKRAELQGIQTENACTLVMLGSGVY